MNEECRTGTKDEQQIQQQVQQQQHQQWQPWPTLTHGRTFRLEITPHIDFLDSFNQDAEK